MGSSLNLGGLVLFVSFLSHGHHFGFHFLFFYWGAQECCAIELALGTIFSLLVPYCRDAFFDVVGLSSP